MDRNHQIIEVVVDDRERNSTIADILAKTNNVLVRVKRLSIGDYLVNGRLLFERKTLTDFAASVVDGRLFKQAIRLAGPKLKSIYVLEGLPGVGAGRAERLLDAFGSVEAVLGASVNQLRSVKGIGHQIAGQIKWSVQERVRDYENFDSPFPITDL